VGQSDWVDSLVKAGDSIETMTSWNYSLTGDSLSNPIFNANCSVDLVKIVIL
jgi:hypothetical protein